MEAGRVGAMVEAKVAETVAVAKEVGRAAAVVAAKVVVMVGAAREAARGRRLGRRLSAAACSTRLLWV